MKKFLVILFALSLSFLVFACGQDLLNISLPPQSQKENVFLNFAQSEVQIKVGESIDIFNLPHDTNIVNSQKIRLATNDLDLVSIQNHTIIGKKVGSTFLTIFNGYNDGVAVLHVIIYENSSSQTDDPASPTEQGDQLNTSTPEEPGSNQNEDPEDTSQDNPDDDGQGQSDGDRQGQPGDNQNGDSNDGQDNEGESGDDQDEGDNQNNEGESGDDEDEGDNQNNEGESVDDQDEEDDQDEGDDQDDPEDPSGSDLAGDIEYNIEEVPKTSEECITYNIFIKKDGATYKKFSVQVKDENGNIIQAKDEDESEIEFSVAYLTNQINIIIYNPEKIFTLIITDTKTSQSIEISFPLSPLEH